MFYFSWFILLRKLNKEKKKKKVKKKLAVSRFYLWKSIPNNAQCKNSFAPTKADPRDIPVNAQYKTHLHQVKQMFVIDYVNLVFFYRNALLEY